MTMGMLAVAFLAATAAEARRRNHQIPLSSNEIGCKSRHSLDVSLPPPVFDNNILTIAPAAFAQTVEKCVEGARDGFAGGRAQRVGALR